MRRVGTCNLHVLPLLRCRRLASPMGGGQFCPGRAGGCSAVSPVVTDIVHCNVVDHSLVVDIRDVCRVDVIHRSVVVEASVAPISALIPVAGVAVAIVNAAVESDDGSPVALIPEIRAVIRVPGPIARSPQRARERRKHPGARDPEVAARAPSPITRRPDISGSGAEGLLVNRQWCRSDCNHHAPPRLGYRWC